jgi:hypothetical protein
MCSLVLGVSAPGMTTPHTLTRGHARQIPILWAVGDRSDVARYAAGGRARDRMDPTVGTVA